VKIEKNKNIAPSILTNAEHGLFLDDRLAFSPAEFARLLGRSATFGYRRIYDGSVRVVTGHGRMLVPRSEIERFLSTAAFYDGVKVKSVKRQMRLKGSQSPCV
jgi:hypothetical protein